ncbi:MAG: hypothetical protein U0175_35740 [Caldilineaceae bacterium]
MSDCTVIYKSFILRFWQDNPQSPWRATVKAIQSQETTHFANLDALFAYLATQTAWSQIADSLPGVKETN